MNICFITPPSMLKEIATLSKTHLVLAHIYSADKEYRDFYKERVKAGDWVMLDNSAYELGESVAVQSLINIAMDLKPNAIFLPDVRFDKDKTLANAKNAISLIRNYGITSKLIAVPQGSTQEEVLECYDSLVKLGVDGFGLYEEIGQVCALDDRAGFLDLLEKTGRVVDGFYYHLLGMEESVEEIRKLAKFKWANSIDSVKPIVYGMYEIELKEEGADKPYPHRPKDYFYRNYNGPVPATIVYNCRMAYRWAKGES